MKLLCLLAASISYAAPIHVDGTARFAVFPTFVIGPVFLDISAPGFSLSAIAGDSVTAEICGCVIGTQFGVYNSAVTFNLVNQFPYPGPAQVTYGGITFPGQARIEITAAPITLQSGVVDYTVPITMTGLVTEHQFPGPCVYCGPPIEIWSGGLETVHFQFAPNFPEGTPGTLYNTGVEMTFAPEPRTLALVIIGLIFAMTLAERCRK